MWSPDGRYLAYLSGNLPGRPGNRALSIAAADGTGVVRAFLCPRVDCEPTDWSPDGRHLLASVSDARGTDVWTVSVEDGRSVQAPLASAFTGRDARLSPDGRWIAYVSQESGRPEVSVRNVAGPPKRTVVSGAGGTQPVWRRNGAELFFVDPQGRLRSVSVHWTDDGNPRFGVPAELSTPPIGFGHGWGAEYDVAADGRIYIMRPNDDPRPREIQVVLGWPALLE